MSITYPENGLEPAPAFRTFEVGVNAERQGRALGYTPDVLAGFARRAARYKDAIATHRFKDLAFEIDGDTIISVWHIVG